MSTDDRYARQVRLHEVGPSGQASIERSRAVVRGREGASIEREYLLRAGVGSVSSDPDAPADPFSHAGAFRYAVTRDFAAGAFRALSHLRGAIASDR